MVVRTAPASAENGPDRTRRFRSDRAGAGGTGCSHSAAGRADSRRGAASGRRHAAAQHGIMGAPGIAPARNRT